MFAGLDREMREQGLPVRMLTRTINGRVYTGWKRDAGASGEDAQQAWGRLDMARATRAPGALPDWTERVLPWLRALDAWIDGLTLDTAPAAEAAGQWNELWHRLREAWYLHFSFLMPCYKPAEQFGKLCAELFPGMGLPEALRLIQARTETLYQVQADLHRLADAARGWPDVLALLSGEPPDAAYRQLGQVAGGREWLEQLGGFLAEHGHLGADADDLSLPTWADEPWRVLPEAARMLGVAESPRQRRERLLAESDAFAAQLRERLDGRPDDRKRFDEALGVTRTVNPLLEDHNYWLDRKIQARMHRVVLQVGRRLVETGVLARPAEAFLLHAAEIAESLERPVDASALVRRRREELARWASLRPPMLLGRRPPEPPAPEQPAAIVDADLLRGTAASCGLARGPVRVIRSTDELGRVRRGDVLVCHDTNPSWVPLFPVIAALVTDQGGPLSHAAVVAREYGVPAVVGLAGATRSLRDGTEVQVDGAAGTVRIVWD
jgi:rifampicin phosphotransferase